MIDYDLLFITFTWTYNFFRPLKICQVNNGNKNYD